MALEDFETRTMLQALEQVPTTPTFLRDRFFNGPANQSATEHLDIDIVKHHKRVPVYVRPIKSGHIVDKEGYETKTYKPPYIKEKIPTIALDVMRRAAGQGVYGGDPRARFAEQLAKELQTLSKMFDLGEEIQCAQGLFTGVVTAKNENGVAIDTISFGLPAAHNLTLTSTDLWSDSGFDRNDLFKQLRGYAKQNLDDSGVASTDVLLGGDALDKFLELMDPPSGASALSSIMIDRGIVNPSAYSAQGVMYIGYIKEIGCNVWYYGGSYWNGSANTPLLDAKKIWIGSSAARFDRNYAAIQDLKSLAPVPRFVKSWEEEDPSVRWLMMQSAPLMAPHQVDSFTVAKVLS